MQLTHVFINRSLPPISQGGQMPIKVFSVGMACNAAYGGGVIASITYERNGAIVIRKDRPFKQTAAGKPELVFDCLIIFPGGEYAYGIDDKQTEQPKQARQDAQPAAQSKGK